MVTVLVLIGVGVAGVAFFDRSLVGWQKFAMGGFSFFWWFLAAIMYLQSYAPYTYYEAGDERVFLRGVYSKGEFRYDQIEAVSVLDEEAYNHFLHKRGSDLAYKEAELDLIGWWKAGKLYGQATRFVTSGVAHSTRTSGSFKNIVSVKSYTAGGGVLLRLVSGEEFLLTPVDPEGLCDRIKSHIPGSVQGAEL